MTPAWGNSGEIVIIIRQSLFRNRVHSVDPMNNKQVRKLTNVLVIHSLVSDTEPTAQFNI